MIQTQIPAGLEREPTPHFKNQNQKNTMTTQEVLTQIARTIDELRQELEESDNKYNVSYQEGYSDAIDEFEELVLNLENEYLYKSNADNGNAN